MIRYFVKIPKVTPMEQFNPPEQIPLGVFFHSGTGRYTVTTAHGQAVYLEPGDWVVQEPDGNGHYPIKDSIQSTTYGEVDAMGYKIVEVKE